MLPKVSSPELLNIAPTSVALPSLPTTAALYSPIGIDSDSNLFDYDDVLNQYSSNSDLWFNGIDDYDSPLSFDASENGLWNGNFVPPPPRPPFLDDSAVPDGLTTCDLCTWAWHDRNVFSIDGSNNESAAELGWTFTLVIVSIISALVGAIIMVIVLRLRRLKTTTSNGIRHQYWWNRNNREPSVTSSRGNNATIKQSNENIRNSVSVHNNAGICTWINNRRSSRNLDQMEPQITLPAENHYTPMDDAYSPAGNEALYAELDRESIRSANPSYQNTAYSQCGELDQDVPIVSSAPSSAYYSDLSTTGTVTADRAYEVVGLTHLSSPITNWEQSETNDSTGRRVSRLAAINESSNTIPSDYV